MEKDINLCLYFLFFSGVSSQTVTITEDTVYVKNNALGQVTCTLNGNCSAISWIFSRIKAPAALAFIGYPCSNTTSGFYQTCDHQNHQYTLYFNGTNNLHGETIGCYGESCTPQTTVLDTVTIFIIVPIPSVALEGINSQQVTVTAGQSKSITCVTGSGRPTPHILWYIGMANMTSSSTETQISSQDLFYTRRTLTFIPTKSQNGLQVNCKAYSTDNNMMDLTIKPTLNVQYQPDDANAKIRQGNSISTIEGYNISLVCEVRGGNPLATITWNCFEQIATSSIDGDISRSIVKFIAHRNNNRQTCTCEASHPTNNLGNDTVTVYVYYIDILSLASTMKFETTQDIQLTCSAKGNHRGVVFHPWTQKIRSSLIRTFNGFNTHNETVVKIPYSSYQDAGNYTCYVYDRNGTFFKSKDVELTVNDKPVITNTFKIQEKKRTVEILVDFYSVPKPVKVEWIKDEVVVSLSERYRQSNTVILVTLTLHEVGVQLKGYRAMLTITNVTADDFGTYLLRIKNVKGIATQQVNFQGQNQQKEAKTITLESTVIGIVIGVSVAVVIAVIVVIVVVCARRERTNKNEAVEMNETIESKYEELESRTVHEHYDVPATEVPKKIYINEVIDYKDDRQTREDKSEYEEIQ